MRTKPTAADVRAYRDHHECGLSEAKAALLCDWRRDTLQGLRVRGYSVSTVEQCRDLIVDLLDLLAESES